MLETTKADREAHAATAAWRLRRPPYEAGATPPVAESAFNSDAFTLAVCRDVDTVVRVLREQANRHDDCCLSCDLEDCACGEKPCECGAANARAVLGE